LTAAAKHEKIKYEMINMHQIKNISAIHKFTNFLKYIFILGHISAFRLAHAVEGLDGADDGVIKQALQWILKVGGWVSIVLFVLGVLAYLGMDSSNSKNIMMMIIGLVLIIFLTAWAVGVYNQKMDQISEDIFN
jgi:hypothetical protein